MDHILPSLEATSLSGLFAVPSVLLSSDSSVTRMPACDTAFSLIACLPALVDSSAPYSILNK